MSKITIVYLRSYISLMKNIDLTQFEYDEIG